MSIGWEGPIREAMRYNAEHANDTGYEDGLCPECAWPLVEKNGKKTCNFCEWSE